MTIEELKERLSTLTNTIDVKVDRLDIAATQAQKEVYKILIESIEDFEIVDKRFSTEQDYSKQFAIIERNIYAAINRIYKPDLIPYLRQYSKTEDSVIELHSSYNNIDVKKSSFTGARRSIYDQAEFYLLEGLNDAYVQPAKYLLLQQVSAGNTVKKARSVITNWDKGTLSAGALASDVHAPRLQAYATQLARDTIFTYQGVIQDIIRDEFKLDRFIYVGGLVTDSRPFCRHLVGLRRKIGLDEIPDLVVQFPEGLKPNTTKKNFYMVRGGYSCRHIAMPVK